MSYLLVYNIVLYIYIYMCVCHKHSLNPSEPSDLRQLSYCFGAPPCGHLQALEPRFSVNIKHQHIVSCSKYIYIYMYIIIILYIYTHVSVDTILQMGT